jgi:hypothetical protein
MYAQAMKGSNSEIWHTSMSTEINDITMCNTYELVPPPLLGTNIIGNTWVLKQKQNTQNKIVKHKSQLCAQGFLQKPSVTPTVHMSLLCYILTLAAAHDLETNQIDFKNAYLNGTLEETIYMHQPRGFEVPGKEAWVWKLKKALYGLKQAGLQWYKVVKGFFEELRLAVSNYNPCVFFQQHPNSNVIIVVIHVDNCIICASMCTLMNAFKAKIECHFEISDLVKACWVLGFKIKHNHNAWTITLLQSAYIDQLLK